MDCGYGFGLFLTIVSILNIFSPNYSNGQSLYQDKILESSIQTLTFTKGKLTTGRRNPGVEQLRCNPKGTAGCKLFTIKTAQCKNQGTNGQAIQWSCTSEMDKNKFMFGKVEVNCEGYNSPQDAFVLKGSCSLIYELDLVGTGSRTGKTSETESVESTTSVTIGIVIVVIFLVCAGCIFVLCGRNKQHRVRFTRDDGDHLCEQNNFAPQNHNEAYTPDVRVAMGFGESTRR